MTLNTSSKPSTTSLEKRRLRQRKHYEANKDKIYKAHRIYIANHSEARKAYLKEYWANPVNQQKRRDWYRKNKEHIKKRDKEHYHKTKERHREVWASTKYGISIETYRELAKKTICDVCRKPEIAIGRHSNIKRLAIDHNHKTGKVRGILCQRCNQAIGLLREDIKLMKNIINYLKC